MDTSLTARTEPVGHAPTAEELLAAITKAAAGAAGRVCLDENELAERLKISVPFLRKDRRTKQIIPFFRIGTLVRYDLGRVRETLAKLEVGGQPRKRKRTSPQDRIAA